MNDYLEKSVVTTVDDCIVQYGFARGIVIPRIQGNRSEMRFEIEGHSPIKKVHFSYPIPLLPGDDVLLAIPLFTVKPRHYHASRGYDIHPFDISSIGEKIRNVELLRQQRQGTVIGYWADTPNGEPTLPDHLRKNGVKINNKTLDDIFAELA